MISIVREVSSFYSVFVYNNNNLDSCTHIIFCIYNIPRCSRGHRRNAKFLYINYISARTVCFVPYHGYYTLYLYNNMRSNTRTYIIETYLYFRRRKKLISPNDVDNNNNKKKNVNMKYTAL